MPPQLLRATLLLFYFAFVVLLHEKIGVLMGSFMKTYGINSYNTINLIAFLLILLASLFSLKKKIRVHPKPNRLTLYVLLHCILITLASYYLLVFNVEYIHIIQYAIFCIIAYPLAPNYFALLLVGLLAGTIDEAYQYFYLAPERTDYFDFNDIILNTLGIGTGIIFLFIQGRKPIKLSYTHWTYVLFIVAVFLTGLSYILGFWSIYPNEVDDLMALIRQPSEGFWTIKPVVTFHIVRPWEGILITIGLLLFYMNIDRGK